MRYKTFVVTQELDERGELEEFSNDTFLILDKPESLYLEDNGLPKVGTRLSPNMLLIAKFGATKSYSYEKLPNDLEMLTMDQSTLIRKYGNMFYDASLYVPEGVYGVVVDAYFEERQGRNVAVVEVQIDETESER